MKTIKPLRIVALEVSNFKAIRAVAIAPNRNVVQITGENEAGKSSVLDAIFCALAGKKALPSQPVRRGEDTAFVRLDLGEVKVTRRVAVDGKTDVIVEAESGARFPSPQRMLDDLLGELSFDPLRFALSEPRAQLETLRGLVKLDVDVDALDRANARDYELRRDVNRDARSLEERVATLAEGVDLDMDVTPIDVTAWTEEMATAAEHNAAIERERIRREERNRRIEDLNARAGEQYERARELRRQAAAAEAEGDKHAAAALRLYEEREAEPTLTSAIDVRELQDRINEAGKANARKEHQARQRRAHAEAVQDLTDLSARSAALTRAMDERTAEKTAAISRAKMPIDGLGFGDGQVTYNGLPFAQASQAQRIRVSFAVAMAMNPRLRIALIRDASLLDNKNLALIEQMAEENDFQVFMERVDSTGKVGVLIQDGQVAAIDGVPVGPTEDLEPIES